MKKLMFVSVVAFACCTAAVASDLALYIGPPNDGWYDAAQVLVDAQTIVDETGAMFKDVSQFDDNQFDDFAAWIDERTDDGKMDIIWLNGTMPSVLYPFPNLEADGSRAELWLDGGNMLINVADWFGYMSYEGGTRSADNGGTGAANILDLSSGVIVSADGTTLPVTAEGREYLPSLDADDPVHSDRPIALSAVTAPWEVVAIFAGTATQADPLVIHNTDTDGYVAFINQANLGNSIADRGVTTAEFIANWVNEVIGLGGGGNPLARRPDPEDGALFFETWGTLTWKPGYYAVSHDVYMGANFDDVNSGAADTFIGNQGSNMLIVGFPGFPFPDGLVPGTTYYWRIDEVNDANAASPWKGDVWSFSIPPKTGYDPIPADGAKFVETEAPVLSWAPGFDAKLHTVYFGDSFADVDAAAGGLPQALTTFTPPGPLEPEKTYFWRVDEFDVATTHKGPVWSFTTAREGGGIKGEYFNNENLTGAPVLTRIDDLINFYWNPGPDPPPGINEDYFSVRWTGELEAPFSEPFTFTTGTDDGARLYLDGKRIVNDWGGGHDYTEVSSDPIDLVAGQCYALIMEGLELGGEAEWRLFWESPSMPRQVVPQAALSLLVHAHSPKPAGGTQGVSLMSDLIWGPGEFASSHEVYLGTDSDAVANATKASPEYKGGKALGEESFDPGQLAFDTTYYWRIDEVNATNPDSPWAGNVWSFWTGDFLVVDDFESYDDIDPVPGETGNRIFDKWIDGYGTTTNGALVGNDLPPYAEQTIVNGGVQSMIYRYDLAGKSAEATLTLQFPKDWTANGVTKLSLQFRGSLANSADKIFVALGNSVVYHPDDAATQGTGWNEWVINLTDFAGTDLTNVGAITIGVGTRNVPGVDATGTMYFDDIRLIQ